MSTRARIVGEALDVSIPTDYVKFLDTYGMYEDEGVEVYGLDDAIIDPDKIPCVIGATRILRKTANLPKQFLAVHHTGYEDEVVCLDSTTGEVVLLTHGTMSKIAETFSAWFSREILGKKD
jgi:hypothetical protein